MAIGTVASIFVVIAGLWVTSQTFATDVELAAAKDAVIAVHEADKVTQAEADKNDRVDRVDRDIRKMKRLIEFGPKSEKEYNEAELEDLKTLKQNILDGKR